MSSRYPLHLSFRGSRDYLQGGDIYQKLIEPGEATFPKAPVHVQFHTLLRRQPDIVWSKDSLTAWRNDPDYRGEATFGAGPNTVNVVLLESERPVTERRDCNEQEVIATAMVDVPNKSATLPFPNCGTMIEMIISLNKQLHFNVLPDVQEKWLFVKLELSEALPESGEKELTLVMKQVLGNRFTKTAILIDGKAYGFITFSTAK